MPRPKVPLEDRQRAVKACLPCKASKKRCDAQQPCSNCIRRRGTSFCHYVNSNYVKQARKFSQSHTADSSAGQDESVSIAATEPLHTTPQKPVEDTLRY